MGSLTSSTRWSILVPYEETERGVQRRAMREASCSSRADPNLDESLAEARPWREFRWHAAVK